MSNGTEAPPAFITANIATGIHRDFSKHNGTMLLGFTPRSISCLENISYIVVDNAGRKRHELTGLNMLIVILVVDK
jgi:hypothetical protein